MHDDQYGLNIVSIPFLVLAAVMRKKIVAGSRKYRHIFLDAEGTLYVPKSGRSRWEFWSDPSPEAAVNFFEPDIGVKEALGKLRRKVDTLGLVSWNSHAVLDALLREFNLRDYFDCILVNGDKGKRIANYLERRGLKREEAIMVGDMPKLDLYPVRRAGIDAILVSRDYNWYAKSERINGVNELPDWLRIADIADGIQDDKGHNSTLDDFAADIEPDRKNTKRLIAPAVS